MIAVAARKRNRNGRSSATLTGIDGTTGTEILPVAQSDCTRFVLALIVPVICSNVGVGGRAAGRISSPRCQLGQVAPLAHMSSNRAMTEA